MENPAALVVLASIVWYQIHAQSPNPTFFCQSGGSLDSLHSICDGRTDCHDGSDESATLCSRTLCPESKFKCLYGACVDRSKKCDGIRDCADGSDERNCGRKPNSCATNEFRCEHLTTGINQCILSSNICNGIRDCGDGSDEAATLCHNTLCPMNSFRCQYGGCVPANVQCDGFRDCFDGSDESPALCLARNCPKCRQSVRCRPIVTPSVMSTRIDATCAYNDETVGCTEAIRPGTKVTYSCKEYYLPADETHMNNNENLCQADGTWLRDILKCYPNCGHLSSAVPLIVHGWPVSAGLPWHASLYIIHDIDSADATPTFSCGATLISEASVITAAHCVWNLQPQQVIIGLGNTRAHYNSSEDRFVDYYKARNIVKHPLYLDKHGNYGSDIALIEISGNVPFTDFIRPICIDWELDDITSHLADQSLGIAIGLGVTEHMRYSDELRALSLPVVSNERCAEAQKPDFRKFITFTTFCAGWANGSGVCNGDSGGGLFFPKKRNSDQWCLQGIVSLSPRKTSTAFCDPEQYTIFTKVGIYVKWIRYVLANIHNNHNLPRENDEGGPIL